MKDKNGIEVLPYTKTYKNKLKYRLLPEELPEVKTEFHDETEQCISNKNLLKRQKHKCFYCGIKLYKYTIDHFYPRSLGYGINGNKVLACKKCNEEKANRLPTKEEIKRFNQLYKKLLDTIFRKMYNGVLDKMTIQEKEDSIITT